MNRNWNKDWRKSIIIMSGGFDPIHKGHLRMFREASWLGHQVIIGLNFPLPGIITLIKHLWTWINILS